MKSPIHMIHRGWSIPSAALVWLGAGLLLLFPTLTRVPGFAHALAMNLLTGTVGLWMAIVVGRHWRRHLEQEAGHQPGRSLTSKQALRAVGAPALASVAMLWILILVSLALALLNGLRVGLCEVRSVLPFYGVLPMLSALPVALTGVIVAFSTRSRGGAAALATCALLLTGAITAWPILTGPQSFGYNHLLGHLPGPIYDERFSIDAALIGWRGLTLAWSVFLLAAGALLLRPDGSGIGLRPRLERREAAVLLVLAIIAIGALQWKRSELGFHQSHRSVARALGAEVRTDRFVIHYPKERSPEWVERLVLDHEYQYSVVADWLDLGEDTDPVRSYVFRTSTEKGRLTGAGRTSIAKPWLGAMYLHDQPHPHPILRHELIHVLAGSFGSFPFRASGKNPLAMNSGLVEGLAVAGDWPADELCTHGWARAMREVGVAPDVRGLFSAGGFFSQSSTRAYVLAGSFVRWLTDTQGIGVVKSAYRAGDLAAAGEPETLFEAWEAFLDAMPLDDGTRLLAEHRFRRPSILRRPCAFDVAAAKERARQALNSRDHQEAVRWYSRAAELEPDDPWHLKGLLDAHLAAGDLLSAQASTEEILAHRKADGRLRAEALMALGDLAWRREEPEAALERYQAVRLMGSGAGAALSRLAAAKTIAVSDPLLFEKLRPILLGEMRRELSLLVLRDLLDERPEEALVHYLMGRQLYNAGAFSWAVRHLRRADELALTDAGGLRIEGLRLLARALFEEGTDLAASAAAWEILAADPGAKEGDRLDAGDWARRARFTAAYIEGQE